MQIADFKTAVRAIAKYSTAEEDEWRLQTSYRIKHRLGEVAVESRQAAIKGLPKVSEADAKSIVQGILAMRGADKKKHKELHAAGNLCLHERRLPMQGAMQCWRKAVGEGQYWSKPDLQYLSEVISLKHGKTLAEIMYPECRESHRTKKLQLQVNIAFSGLACQCCRNVSLTSMWRCRCNILWYKCPIHVHENVMKAKLAARSSIGSSRKKREERFDPERGVERQMPKRRKALVGFACNEAVCTGMQPIVPIARLSPGSILAARCPHLVRPPEAEDG